MSSTIFFHDCWCWRWLWFWFWFRCCCCCCCCCCCSFCWPAAEMFLDAWAGSWKCVLKDPTVIIKAVEDLRLSTWSITRLKSCVEASWPSALCTFRVCVVVGSRPLGSGCVFLMRADSTVGASHPTMQAFDNMDVATGTGASANHWTHSWWSLLCFLAITSYSSQSRGCTHAM